MVPYSQEAALADRTQLPRSVEKAFQDQRQKAKQRGIPFLFTRDEWWAWWQTDGRWEQRGRFGHNLCMGRKGDAGPYSPENVYPTTMAENAAGFDYEAKAAAGRRGAEVAKAGGRHALHFTGRGDGHPRSRAVITPNGRFGSAALAAEAFGVTRQCAGWWAREGRGGWRYETP
jgi:hypothetical protein